MTSIPSQHRLRIIIADDHQQIRDSLRSLIESDFEVVDAVSSGPALLETAGRLRPDLVLLDLSMPQMSGFEAARILLAREPRLLIIAVSQHSERDYITEAFRIGMSGYVLKRHVVAELVGAMRDVYEGKLYLSPDLRVVRAGG